MKGGPTYRVASHRRRNEMTSRDWQLTHQRLPCRAGITAAPTPNPAGPHRRDDEPMMKLRRREPIVCDRVDKNGASQAQSNEDHTFSPSARPARHGRRYKCCRSKTYNGICPAVEKPLVDCSECVAFISETRAEAIYGNRAT